MLKNSYIKLFITVVSFIFLQGCSSNNISIKDLITTNNELQIKRNYKEIARLLIEYKIKLDKRNPNNFGKKWQQTINNNIKHNKINISFRNIKGDHNAYLRKAFDPNNKIKYRNDLLILGIYKLLYYVYEITDNKYTAISYNLKNFKKLSTVLQVIQYRIKHKKDKYGNYLFLTWQKNWQIELEKVINKQHPNYNIIQNLSSIKTKKETIFSSSNMSFENLISKMIYINNDTIKRLGGEPEDLAIGTLKFFLFL